MPIQAFGWQRLLYDHEYRKCEHDRGCHGPYIVIEMYEVSTWKRANRLTVTRYADSPWIGIEPDVSVWDSQPELVGRRISSIET